MASFTAGGVRYDQVDLPPADPGATAQAASEESFPILPSQHQQMPAEERLVSRLVPVLLTVMPTVNEPVLFQALRLWDQHDIFRLRFRKEAGEWRQYYQEREKRELLPPIEMPVHAADDSAEFLQEVVHACHQLMPVINIFTGPCSHIAVLRRQDSLVGIVWLVDHLLVDNASLTLLIGSLARIYQDLLCGQPVRVAADQAVCRWAEHLAKRSGDPHVQQEVAFWESQFTPTDPGRATVGAARTTRPAVRHASAVLDKEQSQELLLRLARERTSFEDFCLATFLEAYRDSTGESEVLLCVAANGREALVPGIDLGKALGCFSLFYPARFQLPAYTDRTEFLVAIREQRRQFSGRKENYALLRFGNGEAATRLKQKMAWEPAVMFNCLGSRGVQAREGGAAICLSHQWRSVIGAFAKDQDQAGTHHSPGSPRRGVTFVILDDSLQISLLFYEDDPFPEQLKEIVRRTRQGLSGRPAEGPHRTM